MERTPLKPTAKGPDETFTGDVWVTPAVSPHPPSRLSGGLVHFTPGARTTWHSHDVGQTLWVAEGEGLVATRDGDVVRIRPGETVWCAAGEEHWHGATETTFLAHLALLEGDEDGSDPTTWLEPVDDDTYRAAHDSARSAGEDR